MDFTNIVQTFSKTTNTATGYEKPYSLATGLLKVVANNLLPLSLSQQQIGCYASLCVAFLRVGSLRDASLRVAF